MLDFVKNASIYLLIAMGLASAYPVRLQKKRVLILMMLPLAALPMYLLFEAAKVQPVRGDRALAVAGLLMTLAMSAVKWSLYLYMKFQRQKSYSESYVTHERHIQIALLLPIIAGIGMVTTKLW